MIQELDPFIPSREIGKKKHGLISFSVDIHNTDADIDDAIDLAIIKQTIKRLGKEEANH